MWPWIYWKSEAPLMGRIKKILEATSQEKFKNRVASIWGLGGICLEVIQSKEHSQAFHVVSKIPSESERKRTHLAVSLFPFCLGFFSSWFSSMPAKATYSIYTGQQRTQGIITSLEMGIYIPLQWKHSAISSPPASTTLAFFCLSLIGYGWSSK